MQIHVNEINKFRPISIKSARFNANYLLANRDRRGDWEGGDGYFVGLWSRNAGPDSGEGGRAIAPGPLKTETDPAYFITPVIFLK
jgi:hypothetical protein